METLTLTEKRRNLLSLAQEKGGITQDDALQIYEHKSSITEATKHLVKHNLLQVKEAPPTSNKKKIWFISDIGESILKSDKTVYSDDS